MSKKRNRHGAPSLGGPPKKKQKAVHPLRAGAKPIIHPPKPQKKTAAPQHPNQAPIKPVIPFVKDERVLLVGEGDFSFAHSLLKHHAVHIESLCATCYDSREALLVKYPQAEGYIDALTVANDEVQDTADDGEGFDTGEEDEDVEIEEDQDEQTNKIKSKPVQSAVLYSIDATKLSTYKALKRKTFTRIIFNFPHVGGKSKDVNRQVRFNQALLHDFFGAAKSLLAPEGTVLVTLFEGVPYTLWNIRDLGRSAGLRVVRSWQFKSEVYPGYEHARTLGNLRAKEKIEQKEEGEEGEEEGDDEAEEADDWSGLSSDEDAADVTRATKTEDEANAGQKRPGRWRGEDRSARTYEFGFALPPKPREPSPIDEDGEFENFRKKKKKRGKGKLFDEDESTEDESKPINKKNDKKWGGMSEERRRMLMKAP